ncbi:MAG: hypothetical protein RLZZ488_813 [Pseudomonadota bacterium]|jgi:hypothetical protein
MMAKLSQFLNRFGKKNAITFSTLLTLALVGIALRARAENKNNKQKDTASKAVHALNEKIISTRSRSGVFDESKAINEWRAFSIYHPNSGLSEDSLFKNFKKRSVSVDDPMNKDAGQSTAEATTQVLGARSLIPILRATFGDQVRGNTEFERDPWFLSHPSALFNPSQMKALCDRDNESEMDGDNDLCWKPSLTDEYLSTLTDFASDACPQLVFRETQQPNKLLNKLVRSADFREQNIRHFAVHSLRIPVEKVTDEWIVDLLDESRRAAGISENQERVPELTEEDLYALACQAMLLSREFYSR